MVKPSSRRQVVLLVGLRATCAIARVVMNKWDTQWMEMSVANGLEVKTGIRYMDD